MDRQEWLHQRRRSDDAGKASFEWGNDSELRVKRAMDHEPDQTVENMQRDEKLWGSRRIFIDARKGWIGRRYEYREPGAEVVDGERWCVVRSGEPQIWF